MQGRRYQTNDHESYICLASSRRWQKILSIKPLQNPGTCGHCTRR
ncbi:hypothetical protein [Clostridium phage Maintenon]|nr:hypothetical protein [Clostridium phage Maintenon]DAH53221.1 MAG TPA: hypothetical protein [Caudoviricetes sp.]